MATPLALAFGKEFLKQCKGYTSKFIDGKTPVSIDKILSVALSKNLPAVEGNTKGFLHYNDLTILYNEKRKVPFLAAYNIDGAEETKRSKRPVFQPDPRIRATVQLGKPFYNLRTDITEFEIGHMASNNEMGRGKNGIVKAFQTFHFTNSVPQAEKLNTGLWKGLESYIIREAATVQTNKRIAVFTGPILTARDPAYIKDPTFKIPLLFFKLVVFLSKKGLYSTAFIMSHEKKLIEDKMFAKPVTRKKRGILEDVGYFNDFTYKDVFQVNIPFLENLSGLTLRWQGVKQLPVPEGKRLIQKIKGIGDAADAKKMIRRRLRGMAGVSDTGRRLTERELNANHAKLNMILP